MFNATIKGRKVTLTFEIAEKPGPSKSGKSLILASTHGFVALPELDASLSLNLTRKP